MLGLLSALFLSQWLKKDDPQPIATVDSPTDDSAIEPPDDEVEAAEDVEPAPANAPDTQATTSTTPVTTDDPAPTLSAPATPAAATGGDGVQTKVTVSKPSGSKPAGGGGYRGQILPSVLTHSTFLDRDRVPSDELDALVATPGIEVD